MLLRLATNTTSRKRASWRVALLLWLAVTVVFGQSTAPSAASPSNASPQQPAPESELTTHEEIQTFQVKVNLVEVRVVVRDAHGNAVGNLKQEDFQLFDDNKPQTIKSFAVEKREAVANPVAAASTPQSREGNEPGKPPVVIPSPHRVAFFFDDVNATSIDLNGGRNAAQQRVNAMKPGESIAIFTASGQGNQDFTDDQEKLRAALLLLKPRPVGGFSISECPPINYYIANQIVNNHDGRALTMVEQEVVGCQFDGNGAASSSAVEALARSAADRVLQSGDAQTTLLLSSLGDVVRRMSALPGQRTLVFLSPGFVVGGNLAALNDYLNRAIRAGVIISTLDVKGLFTQSANGVDISQKAWGSSVVGADMISYSNASDLAQSEPLLQIAEATGGSYFHNRNDLAAGLDQLTMPPEYSYLLGFSPQELKNDGKFHALKVRLRQGDGLAVQARKGYVAPRKVDAGQEAQQEISDEVFAQNEIQELPLLMQTQYYLSGDDKAHINVVIRVDVKRMAFKKSEGRNLNDLTVVTALFDRNANFISAKSNTVQMHIKDETLAKLNSGITLRSNFDVGPGSYVIRVVARDAQGKLAAQNGVIEIP